MRLWDELTRDINRDLGFRRCGLVYATHDEAVLAGWERWREVARRTTSTPAGRGRRRGPGASPKRATNGSAGPIRLGTARPNLRSPRRLSPKGPEFWAPRSTRD